MRNARDPYHYASNQRFNMEQFNDTMHKRQLGPELHPLPIKGLRRQVNLALAEPLRQLGLG